MFDTLALRLVHLETETLWLDSNCGRSLGEKRHNVRHTSNESDQNTS